MSSFERKEGDIGFKVDLEKAYDRLDWKFLESSLYAFGFPRITIRLIMHCLSSSSQSLVWNGKKLPNFSPLKGLRLHLFVICMEQLLLAINEEANNYTWFPVKISINGAQISHLSFVDDVLQFAKAKSSQKHFLATLEQHEKPTSHHRGAVLDHPPPKPRQGTETAEQITLDQE